MASAGSISQLIDLLKTGDNEAVEAVWERVCNQLERLARRKLQGISPGEADEEDLALSAFASFCRAVAEGRFPQLADRNQLWALLVGVTKRKARDHWRRVGRQKRGGRAETTSQGVEHVADREPTPEFTALMADECQRLLHDLGDARLRKVALMKMEEYTDQEIAAALGCGLRTVERKLERIRSIWERELTS